MYRFLAPKLSMGPAVPVPSLCAFMTCYRVTFAFRGLHLYNLGKVSLVEYGRAGRVQLR